VFKRDGRFYCHVHGPTALMAAAAGNNQQQKKKQQPQLQQLNVNEEEAVLGTGNGKAAKREPEMREVEAESLRLAAKLWAPKAASSFFSFFPIFFLLEKMAN